MTALTCAGLLPTQVTAPRGSVGELAWDLGVFMSASVAMSARRRSIFGEQTESIDRVL